MLALYYAVVTMITAITGCATDINVSVNTKNVTIVIYKKTPIGKEQLLEELCDAGNYNYEKQRFENGVLLKEIFDISSGMYFYYVGSWYGPQMYGEGGYCDTWTENKYAES